MTKVWFAICALVVGASHVGLVSAAELKLLSPVAMRGVMPDVTAQFERSSGHKITVEYATVGAISERLLKGEPADAAIVSGPLMEELQKQGKIAPGSRVDMATVGVAVFVRKGAQKPEIGSVDAVKRMLLSAKSLSYGDPASGGVSGVHMARVVERLGIAADLKAKTRLLPNSPAALDAVAKGNVDVGIGLTSDVALVANIDLVGALPKEIQNITLYSAGAVASSKQAGPANALVKFLSSPAAKAALKAKGFEPN